MTDDEVESTALRRSFFNRTGAGAKFAASSDETMIRGFFRLIFRLISLVLLILIATVIWVVADGLNDHGDKADVGVVPGNAVRRDGMPGPILRARLDHAIELYQKGDFPLIIVSGATKTGGYNEPAVMANYLVEHQVPRPALIEDTTGANTDDTGIDVARLMRARHLTSAMIVTNYYHITRMKLALQHAGIHNIEQSHVGVVTKDDAFMLGREVIALYYYLGRFYLFPAAEKAQEEAKADSEKIKQEAQVDSEKAQEEADKVKEKANQDLDSLRK
jgi:vancomycin permeability regulator SanA